MVDDMRHAKVIRPPYDGGRSICQRRIQLFSAEVDQSIVTVCDEVNEIGLALQSGVFMDAKTGQGLPSRNQHHQGAARRHQSAQKCTRKTRKHLGRNRSVRRSKKERSGLSLQFNLGYLLPMGEEDSSWMDNTFTTRSTPTNSQQTSRSSSRCLQTEQKPRRRGH